MRGLIERLCTMADLIILDSPPVLAVTDPMLLSPLVDGVILVVDAQHTGRQAVKRAAETIKQASPPLLATALNKVRPTGRSGYDYYYYYYASDNGTENGSKGRLGRLKKILRAVGVPHDARHPTALATAHKASWPVCGRFSR